MPTELVLASASPRRLELLRLLGLEPRVDPAAIDESPRPGLAADQLAVELARDKARAVAARHPAAVVLGADTLVVVDGAPLGKPADERAARAMLERLSGRGHSVVTAVHLVPPRGAEAPELSLRVATAVAFRALAPSEIERYVASGEWRDKAGGYAIQERAASFARAVIGSYTNVVGLPLAEVADELRRLGVLA
jgi:septum formation protein